MTHDEMIKAFIDLNNHQLKALGIITSVRNIHKYNAKLEHKLTSEKKHILLHSWIKELASGVSTKRRIYEEILEYFLPREEWEHEVHSLGYPPPGRIITHHEIEKTILDMLSGMLTDKCPSCR